MPYRSGTSGYHTFRIPAALHVPGGALLAFAEGRRNSSADDGDIDLVLRRSLDGGCTWQPMQLVADAGKDTVGNPVPVIDPRTGDIVLLTCRTTGGATKRQVMSGKAAASVRRVYVQRSADGGRTWSAQRDITGSVKSADWRWYAVGPGHAVALRHESHRGRLLVPANHSSGTTGLSGAHSLYSDDGGHTWHIGYVSGSVSGPLSLNESTLAELPDGTVYINARDHDRTAGGTRADAYQCRRRSHPVGSLPAAAPADGTDGPGQRASGLRPAVEEGAVAVLRAVPPGQAAPDAGACQRRRRPVVAAGVVGLKGPGRLLGPGADGRVRRRPALRDGTAGLPRHHPLHTTALGAHRRVA